MPTLACELRRGQTSIFQTGKQQRPRVCRVTRRTDVAWNPDGSFAFHAIRPTARVSLAGGRSWLEAGSFGSTPTEEVPGMSEGPSPSIRLASAGRTIHAELPCAIERPMFASRKSMKFTVWGPDGIPIQESPFASREAAERGIANFVDRFRSQGYYAGVGYRLKL